MFQFRPEQTDGDTITDFTGNGVAVGDTIQFIGFGAGAIFNQIDPTHGVITYNGGASHETIGLANSPTIDPSDVVFV